MAASSACLSATSPAKSSASAIIVDRRAGTPWAFAEHLEHLIDRPILLCRCCFEIVFEYLAQVPVGGLIDHFGQGFHDLTLSA